MIVATFRKSYRGLNYNCSSLIYEPNGGLRCHHWGIIYIFGMSQIIKRRMGEKEERRGWGQKAGRRREERKREKTNSEGPGMGTSRPLSSGRYVVLGKKSASWKVSTKKGDESEVRVYHYWGQSISLLGTSDEAARIGRHPFKWSRFIHSESLW